MDINIVDTTMRDGEQRPGISLDSNKKKELAILMDGIGIYQIEAGIPVMDGEEKKSIDAICKLGLKSIISAWNRMNIEDIKHSMDCNVDLIHFSVPVSDLHIQKKLIKDREWVKDKMLECIGFIRNNGFEISIGFEDSSRADRDFLTELMSLAAKEGIQQVRVADTVGLLHTDTTIELIRFMKGLSPIEIEMHAHNDFGLAVPNSIAAASAGATLIDCTFGGIGERSGNCSLLHFTKAARSILNCKVFKITDTELTDIENRILKIIYM